jgi:mannose-6-phosphate isomerase-like protein (cupin superfamily)
MIHCHADKEAKGWFFGPWNSDVPIPVGYANEGLDLTHYHEAMYEIYFVAQGTSTIVIDEQQVDLRQGDVVAVAPNEVHTFIASSDDYFHFVVQTPFVKGDKVIVQSDVNEH